MDNHRYQQIPVTGDEIEGHRQQQAITTPPEPHQRSDLEETFDIQDEEDDNYESHQLLPPSPPVLNSSSSSTSLQQHQGHSTATNDGVFSNMSAKPDSESNKTDEVPPAYEEAAADATPPYWQTTIIAPAGLGDMVLVEGLPVGSIFSFLWNLLVSSSFQLVGFMLTYLLHTSHAAKDGAKAGLGVTLIQYAFYIRSRGTLENGYGYDEEEITISEEDAQQADIIAYLMMFIGWFIILRAVADYTRACKMEKIICSEPSAEIIV